MRNDSGFYAAALRQFGRLPESLRHWVVGRSSPAYRIGTVAVIRDDEGRVLLARHSYRRGWGLPGGMIGWREEPEETIVREVAEELNLRAVTDGDAHVEHRRRPRRLEFFYVMRLVDGCTPADARPSSPEIEEVRWFALDEFPQLEKDDSVSLRALRAVIERPRTVSRG